MIAVSYTHLDVYKRQLWADPWFARKVDAGRIDEIMRCTRCASCEDPVTQPRICRVNPTLGQERQLAAKPVAKKKRVMVVGGGPAGMECACTLSERGHEVTLYEKAGALGGRIKPVSYTHLDVYKRQALEICWSGSTTGCTGILQRSFPRISSLPTILSSAFCSASLSLERAFSSDLSAAALSAHTPTSTEESKH